MDALNISDIADRINGIVSNAHRDMNRSEDNMDRYRSRVIKMIENTCEAYAESKLQALKEGLGERLEEIAMKHKLSEGKPEGANGYGEAFWCGRERELQEVLNIINKYSQT